MMNDDQQNTFEHIFFSNSPRTMQSSSNQHLSWTRASALPVFSGSVAQFHNSISILSCYKFTIDQQAQRNHGSNKSTQATSWMYTHTHIQHRTIHIFIPFSVTVILTTLQSIPSTSNKSQWITLGNAQLFASLRHPKHWMTIRCSQPNPHIDQKRFAKPSSQTRSAPGWVTAISMTSMNICVRSL